MYMQVCQRVRTSNKKWLKENAGVPVVIAYIFERVQNMHFRPGNDILRARLGATLDGKMFEWYCVQ
jgi:hypothetical protein